MKLKSRRQLISSPITKYKSKRLDLAFAWLHLCVLSFLDVKLQVHACFSDKSTSISASSSQDGNAQSQCEA